MLELSLCQIIESLRIVTTGAWLLLCHLFFLVSGKYTPVGGFGLCSSLSLHRAFGLAPAECLVGSSISGQHGMHGSRASKARAVYNIREPPTKD